MPVAMPGMRVKEGAKVSLGTFRLSRFPNGRETPHPGEAHGAHKPRSADCLRNDGTGRRAEEICNKRGRGMGYGQEWRTASEGHPYNSLRKVEESCGKEGFSC